MNLLSRLGNPYLNFAGSFLLAALLYSPQLSSVFPELGLEVYFLLASTIFMALLIGVFSQRSVDRIIFNPIQSFSPYAPKLFLLVLLMAIFEIAIYPVPPLVMAVLGEASHKAFVNEYGIPVIHAVVLALCQVVVVQGVNELISGSGQKLRVVLSIVGSIFLLLVFFSRGALVICFLSSVFCFVSRAKGRLAIKFLVVMLSMVFFLYAFGWLGNIRTGDENYLLEIGEANLDVFGGVVPREFFWGYIYYVSPLANLQLSIGLHEQLQQFNFIAVAVLDMVPDVVSKRITSINQEWLDYRPLVHPALTVGSIFARPYYFAGVVGAAVVFWWAMFIVFLSLRFSRGNPYGVTMLGFANVLGFLCIFTNSAVFSSVVGPIGICAVLGLFSKFKWNTKNPHAIRN